MLVDSEEKCLLQMLQRPKRFARAANRLGMNLETISPDDLSRLGEFDGLFIRADDKHQQLHYRFAKTAEKMGLVVMDDLSRS